MYTTTTFFYYFFPCKKCQANPHSHPASFPFTTFDSSILVYRSTTIKNILKINSFINKAYILYYLSSSLHLHHTVIEPSLVSLPLIRNRQSFSINMSMLSSSSDTVKQSQKLIVLKVPVDCEGCRKKVIKIVNTINGVETCEVDIKQQKVVVKGDVDVVTLLKTLVKKTGKHAELWPEDRNVIRKTKKKKAVVVQDGEAKELQSDQENRAEEQRVSNSEEEGKLGSETGQNEEEVKAEMGMDAQAPPSAEEVKAQELNKKKSKGQNGKEKIHIRVESPPLDHHNDNPPPSQINNITPRQHSRVNGQTSSSPLLTNYISPRHSTPSTSLPANNTTATASTSARYSPSYYHPHPQPQPVYTVSYSAAPPPQTSRATVQHQGNSNPPRHPAPRPSYFHHPQPQQHVYTMSYNVAPRMPQTSVSYNNPRPYRSYDDEVDYDGYGYRQQQQQQQLESFGMFSDENPNACSIG